jgi:hypothetical protein
MEAIRQIYEKMPAFVSVPQEMRDRKAETIENDTPLQDAEALEFAGCLPDFPERERGNMKRERR